jgi:hypothetical protein
MHSFMSTMLLESEWSVVSRGRLMTAMAELKAQSAKTENKVMEGLAKFRAEQKHNFTQARACACCVRDRVMHVLMSTMP